LPDGAIKLNRVGGAANALKHAFVAKLVGRKRMEPLELGKSG
jgi:hypothetical protein